jgi:hypothetical protein
MFFEITIVGFVSLLILLIAKSLNKNNAKFILAGYNTMSEEERLKYDIGLIVSLAKKILYSFAVIPFVCFVFFIFFFDAIKAAVVYSAVVLLMIIKFIVSSKTLKSLT